MRRMRSACCARAASGHAAAAPAEHPYETRAASCPPQVQEKHRNGYCKRYMIRMERAEMALSSRAGNVRAGSFASYTVPSTSAVPPIATSKTGCAMPLCAIRDISRCGK